MKDNYLIVKKLESEKQKKKKTSNNNNSEQPVLALVKFHVNSAEFIEKVTPGQRLRKVRLVNGAALVHFWQKVQGNISISRNSNTGKQKKSQGGGKDNEESD